MSMGIVSDDEFISEMKQLDILPHPKDDGGLHNIVHKENIAQILDLPEKGRGKGNIEVPNGLRKLIGQESITNGRESALELASKFNISPSSTAAYAHGSTSEATYDKQPNISTIDKAKARIGRKARNKVVLALNQITEEKLVAAKARDLAGIAKDVSVVAMNMEGNGKKSNESIDKPSFIFYSPKIMTEDHFTVIQVKE